MRRLRGFTLIEVLVALLVVSLSLVAVTAAVAQMVDAGNTMQLRTYASWIGHNRIAELRLALQTPELGRSSGSVVYARSEWDWEATVAETGVEDLYRIDVAVSLAGSDDVIRTVTGFAGPAGVPGAANMAYLSLPSQGSDSPGAER